MSSKPAPPRPLSSVSTERGARPWAMETRRRWITGGGPGSSRSTPVTAGNPLCGAGTFRTRDLRDQAMPKSDASLDALADKAVVILHDYLAEGRARTDRLKDLAGIIMEIR